MLILKRPWTRQPQYAALPDPKYRFVSLWTPAHGHKAINGYTYGVGVQGRAGVGAGSGGRYISFPNTGDIAGSTEASMIVVRIGTSPESGTIASAETTGAWFRCSLLVVSSQMQFRTRTAGIGGSDTGTAQNLNLTNSTSGALEVRVLTWSAAANAKVAYLNGAVDASTTVSGTGFTATPSSHMGLGTPDAGTAADAGPVFLCGWARRAWTQQEAQELSAFYWRAFAPRRTYIPTSVAAASSLPTLSASTYVPGSLTSTGWRPQITAS